MEKLTTKEALTFSTLMALALLTNVLTYTALCNNIIELTA